MASVLYFRWDTHCKEGDSENILWTSSQSILKLLSTSQTLHPAIRNRNSFCGLKFYRPDWLPSLRHAASKENLCNIFLLALAPPLTLNFGGKRCIALAILFFMCKDRYYDFAKSSTACIQKNIMRAAIGIVTNSSASPTNCLANRPSHLCRHLHITTMSATYNICAGGARQLCWWHNHCNNVTWSFMAVQSGDCVYIRL